jgi:hypothetical protein
MTKKYDSPAAKQRAYRQRKDPVKGTLTRIRRFLSLHPDQAVKVDRFMVALASKITKVDKVDRWITENPTGKASMDDNEDHEQPE